jgi:hypothetical protein
MQFISKYSNDKKFKWQVTKDGVVYEIHFVSTEPNKYIKYNEVEVTYKTNQKESTLLNGKFTIV